MNGIMGNSKSMVSEVSSEERLEIPVSEVTEEMKDNLEAKRRQKVGRPRKGESSSKTSEVRATFIVDPEVVRKLKYISLVESNLLKDVIGEALTLFIESWEEENGKIKLPKMK